MESAWTTGHKCDPSATIQPLIRENVCTAFLTVKLGPHVARAQLTGGQGVTQRGCSLCKPYCPPRSPWAPKAPVPSDQTPSDTHISCHPSPTSCCPACCPECHLLSAQQLQANSSLAKPANFSAIWWWNHSFPSEVWATSRSALSWALSLNPGEPCGFLIS